MAQLPSSRHQDRSLTRHPVRALRAMQTQMDRWFEQMLDNGVNSIETELMPNLAFVPSVDIEETDKDYILNFDIPGVKKEDIRVDLHENTLTVSGERVEEHEEKEKKGAVRSERFFGTFQRSFTLPGTIRADHVKADYSDGVLCLKIPKPEQSKTQQIKVGERSGGSKH